MSFEIGYLSEDGAERRVALEYAELNWTISMIVSVSILRISRYPRPRGENVELNATVAPGRRLRRPDAGCGPWPVLGRFGRRMLLRDGGARDRSRTQFRGRGGSTPGPDASVAEIETLI